MLRPLDGWGRPPATSHPRLQACTWTTLPVDPRQSSSQVPHIPNRRLLSLLLPPSTSIPPAPPSLLLLPLYPSSATVVNIPQQPHTSLAPCPPQVSLPPLTSPLSVPATVSQEDRREYVWVRQPPASPLRSPATRYGYPLPPQLPNLPAPPPRWTSPPPQVRHFVHSRVKCPSHNHSASTAGYCMHRRRCLVANTILDASSRASTAVSTTSTRPTTVIHPTSERLHFEVRQCSFRLTTHRQHARTARRALRWLLTRSTAAQWFVVVATPPSQVTNTPEAAV